MKFIWIYYIKILNIKQKTKTDIHKIKILENDFIKIEENKEANIEIDRNIYFISL